MAQKHNQIVFSEYNLGLNNNSNNYKQNGLSKKIENVCCTNGQIKSVNEFKKLFTAIEPARADAVENVFKTTINECLWVTDYHFYKSGKPVKYIVFCASNYKIYYYMLNATNPQFVCLENVEFTSVPKFDYFIKDNQNVMLFCSATDNMWVWDGINEPYQVLDAPKVNSMAVGLERLFVTCDTHPYSVLFSDDLDPSNWSMLAGESGELVFHDNMGKVLMVFALDNYIFVVREQGIVKLYGYKESTNSFTVSRMYTSTSIIHKNTVAVCGDKIIFLCNDGIYSFDGLSAKKLYSQLNGLIFNTQNATAICVDNEYYLSVNMYQELPYNNALICVDLSSDNITKVCCGYVYNRLCKLQINNVNMLIVLTSDIATKNANMPLYMCKNAYKNAKNRNFIYLTNFLNVYPDSQIKVLTRLTFLCKTDITISIITDAFTKEYTVKASDKFQTLKLNLKCNIFALMFSGNNADITHLKLDYTYVE